MKTLVLTIAMGEYHQKMAEITHPLIKSYAEKIGADFKVISEQKISETTPHWEKFQIYDFSKTYDHILFLDTDIIVRNDCPNLFELVSHEKIGAFNESPFARREKKIMDKVTRAYDKTLADWDGRYFNTGVLVLSKTHQKFFKKPEKEVDDFYEQSYLNLVFALEKTPMFELDFRFNRMACMDKYTGEPRLSAYIVHYAGYENPNPAVVFDFIRNDILRWKKRGLA